MKIWASIFNDMQVGDIFYIKKDYANNVQAKIHRYKDLFNKHKDQKIYIRTKRSGNKIMVERIL